MGEPLPPPRASLSDGHEGRALKGLIRFGDTSDEVADVQFRLRDLGFGIEDETGHFGHSTKAAVSAFQQRRSILVDGIVGPQTWNALVEASWRLGDRTLYLKHPHMRGDDVASLQARMNALGFDAGREDGIFGTLAQRAVRAFQSEYGVAEDGIFGPRSQTALAGLRVDRPGTTAQLREELRRHSRSALADATVIVDPGHGGSDRGHEGPRGLGESDICWDLARLVTERLATTGARIRFTRTEPEGLEVSERARRGNNLGGDIFLSLHLNWNDRPSAEGASTYHFGGSSEGGALAEAIQEELVRLGARDCRSHARSYQILRETRMPAVLIEPAFLSNPEEARKLEDPAYRAGLADAMVAGIKNYYRDDRTGSK